MCPSKFSLGCSAFKIYIYVFIWLHQIFVEAGKIFTCGMWTLSWGVWDLVPWPEFEPVGPGRSGEVRDYSGVWEGSRCPLMKAMAPPHKHTLLSQTHTSHTCTQTSHISHTPPRLHTLFLLPGIFPTQRLNLGLPHCRQIIYHLSRIWRGPCHFLGHIREENSFWRANLSGKCCQFLFPA